MIFSHKTLSAREDEPSPLISPLRPPRFESATRFQRNALRSKSRMESYEDEWSLTGGSGLSVMDPEV